MRAVPSRLDIFTHFVFIRRDHWLRALDRRISDSSYPSDPGDTRHSRARGKGEISVCEIEAVAVASASPVRAFWRLTLCDRIDERTSFLRGRSFFGGVLTRRNCGGISVLVRYVQYRCIGDVSRI